MCDMHSLYGDISAEHNTGINNERFSIHKRIAILDYRGNVHRGNHGADNNRVDICNGRNHGASDNNGKLDGGDHYPTETV